MIVTRDSSHRWLTYTLNSCFDNQFVGSKLFFSRTYNFHVVSLTITHKIFVVRKMTNLELIRINFGLSELHVVGQKWPFFGSFRKFSKSLFGQISKHTFQKFGKKIKMFRFNERQTLPNAFVTLANTRKYTPNIFN